MFSADAGSTMGAEYFIQMILALVLVLAVIVLLSVLVKRFSLFTGTSAGPIKILSGISLGGKDRLLLVQVGQEQLLLGMSPGNVQKLHKLQQPIDADSISAARAQDANRNGTTGQNPGRLNFASILNSVSRG